MGQTLIRRLAALALGALGWTTIALSARQATAQQPVFRTGVDLVTIDVTAVDRAGRPIRGLTAADFVVTLEGQRRPVQVLDFLEFGSTGAETPPSQTTNQSPDARRASRGGRVIILLFDDLSATAGEARALIVAAGRMLPTLDVNDLVGLATTSGLGPVVSPTRDRAAVKAALESKPLVGRDDDVAAPFYITVPEALEIDRGFPKETLQQVAGRECGIVNVGTSCPYMVAAAARRLALYTVHRAAMQIAAYTTVIEALRKAPAPRVIIALSKGLATWADNFTELDPLGRASAEAGVQFYALTEVADPSDVRDTTEGRSAARRQENDFLTAGIQTVAAAAGGEAFKVIGQPDRFFTRILSETSGVYRLGVEAPSLRERQRLLSAKVSVNWPGVTVRTNRRALVPDVEARPVSIEDALRARIAQGGVGFGVPIALATALRRSPDGSSLQLGVNALVPRTVPGSLVAMFALVDQSGTIAASGRKEIPPAEVGEDYQVTFPVPLATGSYRLRFAVADAKGNVGSVEVAVTARLPRIGSFEVSDLILSWDDSAGRSRFLALETLPDGAVTINAALELYSDGRQAPTSAATARLALVRADDQTEVNAHDVTPVLESGGRLTAVARFPAATLAAGTYSIRATILESGSTIGVVSATIRKGP